MGRASTREKDARRRAPRRGGEDESAGAEERETAGVAVGLSRV